MFMNSENSKTSKPHIFTLTSNFKFKNWLKGYWLIKS